MTPIRGKKKRKCFGGGLSGRSRLLMQEVIEPETLGTSKMDRFIPGGEHQKRGGTWPRAY